MVHEKASAPLATDRSADCLTEPVRDGYCLRWMAVGDKVEAETKKALGLGENDDLEVYCKEYEDIALSSGMVFLRRR